MIVAPLADQLLLITQNDHAHFASELLSVWRTDGLPEHPRRREILFAAREHDNGWREVDSAPVCRLTDRRPHDFMTVPKDLRQEIWRRGTRRFAQREPFAALLILRHALQLHRAHRDDSDWEHLFGEWQELEAELSEAAATDPTILEADYPWIDLSDQLSLATCNRWTDRIEAYGFSAELSLDSDNSLASGNVLTIDPFPLAGVTTFRVACRAIPDRDYSGDADLAVELATARWQELTVRIAPADQTQ